MSRKTPSPGGRASGLGPLSELASFGGDISETYSPSASYHAQLPPLSPITDITVVQVSLPLAGTETTGTVRAALFASDGTLPTTVLAESGPVAINALPRGGDPAETTFTFPPTKIPNGTNYHVGIHATNNSGAPEWGESVALVGQHNAYSYALPTWAFTTSTAEPVGSVTGTAP